MSIHEQITALLDGELAEAGAVADLMHVLAVSPEKQQLLVEQLALKRHFASSAARTIPPAMSDLAIMRGLGAIDQQFAASGTFDDSVIPAPIPTGGGGTLMRPLFGAIAVVLLLGAFGAGYILRGDSERIVTRMAPARTANAGDLELASMRDSLATLRATLASLEGTLASARQASADQQTAASQSRRQGASARMAYEPKARTSAAERAATTNAAMTSAATTNAAAHSDAASAELPPAQVRSTRTIEPPIPATADEPLPVSSPAATTSESDPIAFVEDDRTPIGAQVGFRNHFRLSLPRVYGLSPSPTALLDRELVASLELGGQGEGLLARLRAGVGIGQTQFSMVFHTNTGGEPVDTVFEQSPQAFYGRAFIAPELVRFVNTTGMLEVGGGYSSAGGFGTVGINLEYRPVSEIALHAGASTWLLWTRFKNGVVDLSTNLNAHIGAVYGF